MKRFIFILFMISCFSSYAQTKMVWSSDSSRIKYASFEEQQTRNMNAETFFSSVLNLPTSNVFFATDTVYSPTPSLCFVKYMQSYAGYMVENSQVTLTYKNNNIVRMSGYYLPIRNMSVDLLYSEEDAIRKFKQFYNIDNEDCLFSTDLLITQDTLTPANPVLCYKIESNEPSVSGKVLYIDASTLSVVRESHTPIAGFNSTFYTQYNGVIQGNSLGFLAGTDSMYVLKDFDAAVEILMLEPDVTINELDNITMPNTFYNSSSVWGLNTSNLYPNYILDAYWAGTQYSYYMQNKLNCPKDFFQRWWNSQQWQYVVNDTTTSIYIASNTFEDETFWFHQMIESPFKAPHEPVKHNIIVIGSPGSAHLPKASIDEVVHEYAHIFAHQSWYINDYYSPIETQALSEACADIWAAIITHEIYPNDESKIWKIGEDIVLTTSGNTCVRNLANPADPDAEIQMLANYCDSLDGTSYEESGIISHWFYLLTHGYNGQGCNGNCYSFPAIPIDSAAKLMYYAERTCFNDDMDYSDICLATMNACENFSNPAEIRASVVGSWAAVGIRLSDDFGVERYGLSLTGSNANAYTIDENLVVDTLQTLVVAGTLHLNDSSRIIVKPGGKLIVDGGTLTSACQGEMWQGIQLEGHSNLHQNAANQGTVQLINGAVIENAHCGILTCNPADSLHTTGGIITADSATFRNCAKAVDYQPYTDINYAGYVIDNKGVFHNCTFTINDNNLFASSNTSFSEHVRLWDVKGVTFSRCRFEDARTVILARKTAINAHSAGFIVRTECQGTPGHPLDCACPTTTNSYCSFSGFGTAVNASTSGSPYPIAIDGGRFTNNVTGVSISGSSHAGVTHCTFDMSYPEVRVVTGLALNGCTGYLVEENTFTRDASAPVCSRRGISVNASGTDANGLYRNFFERLSYGIFVSGTNGTGISAGLQMSCDSFTGCNYGMYLSNTAIVGIWQGNDTIGADNMFSNIQTSCLYNVGNQSITYFHSPGTSHHPCSYTTNNVAVVANAGGNSCFSTLCSNGGGTPNPKSPTPAFLALKQQYEELSSDFARNGYAQVLEHADDNSYDAATVTAAENASQQLNAVGTEMYALSYSAVRTLMNDSLEDILAVRDWLDATPGLASRYLEAETEFAMGGGNLPLADIANHIATSEERDEYDNYLAFNSLKESLHYGNGHVAWTAATDAQIGELIRIVDANTGRASLLAKNVLCFFFELCYDDDAELRALATTAIPPQAEPPALPEQRNIIVQPNPTDGILHIMATDREIARVEMTDMFGRITMVGTQNLAAPPSPKYTVDLSSLPSGMYLLRVTLRDGTVRTEKVVKR